MKRGIERLKRFLFGSPTLYKGHDTGKGPIVLLLHGIGQSHHIWQPVIQKLGVAHCRVVALDLLGFGASPKPTTIKYDVDDHANAVVKTITKLRPDQPLIIVGHSMGALIAVRIAVLRPDLVKHLVLFEMPLYAGLPNKRRYQWRVEAYYALYKQITELTPDGKKGSQRLKQKIVEKVTGQKVTGEAWHPYIQSLRNTIVKQNTAQQLKSLAMPIDVIYGKSDMLVIRGKVQHIFGTESANITAHTIRERHTISKRSGGFLAERIWAALEAKQTVSGYSALNDLVR